MELLLCLAKFQNQDLDPAFVDAACEQCSQASAMTTGEGGLGATESSILPLLRLQVIAPVWHVPEK